MSHTVRILTRRQLLQAALAMSGLSLAGLAEPALAQRHFTPPLTLGPFYPEIKPLDQDADLTVLAGADAHAQGQVLHLTGRVLNVKGEPVSGAEIEIWQADAGGRYTHPRDPNPGPRDRGFQGYGVQKTDAEGRYRFKTVKPGAYPGFMAGMRTPHIHFAVSGKVDRVITQAFFPGEPLNAQDAIFQSIKGDDQRALMMQLAPVTEGTEAGSLHARWDVVLLTG